MSYKSLFSRSLTAHGDKLHMAAHSHHLWPNAAYDGQMQAFEDAAQLSDDKWDHIFGHVYPEAQGHVAREISWPDPSDIVFAPNTHQLIVTLFSAIEHRPIRVLTTDGEFHSLSRQLKRWEESGDVVATQIMAGDEAAFLTEARSGAYDIIFTSEVFFGSGQSFAAVNDLAALARPEGPWIVIDGYHSFRARPTDLSAVADKIFYLGGGYKYAMAGEGCAFMCAPKGFAPRPIVTGWYAAFGDLIAPPKGGVGFAADASRFMGATFDPSGLYRFNAVQRMLAENGLTTDTISSYVAGLQSQLWDGLSSGSGTFSRAKLINKIGRIDSARFLALRHPETVDIKNALHNKNIVTDVREDVLRIGLALYHDAEDIDRFIDIAATL